MRWGGRAPNVGGRLQRAGRLPLTYLHWVGPGQDVGDRPALICAIDTASKAEGTKKGATATLSKTSLRVWQEGRHCVGGGGHPTWEDACNEQGVSPSPTYIGWGPDML